MTATPSIDLPGWMAEQLSKEALARPRLSARRPASSPATPATIWLIPAHAHREEIAS
jgi:hypothetical protein